MTRRALHRRGSRARGQPVSCRAGRGPARSRSRASAAPRRRGRCGTTRPTRSSRRSSSAARWPRSTRCCAAGPRTASRCPPACRPTCATSSSTRAQLPAWADTAQAQGGGRLQQEARHLPRRRLRLRQRHDEHGHPARGARGLLLQGRRRHEAPHLAHGEVRLRHRLARRLPRPAAARWSSPPSRPGWRTPACGTCCRSRRTGRASPTRTSRSASATSSSPGTACRPR